MTKSKITRREFIKISAVASSVLVGGSVIQAALSSEIKTIEEIRLLMGTIINLTLVSDDENQAREAIEHTFGQLEQMVSIFNHRQPDGPLGRLNTYGHLADPPQELVYVIKQSFRFSELTVGAFDVSIKPLVDLYRQAQADGSGLPDEERVKTVAKLVNYTQILVSDDKIEFAQPGMQVSLDGIAKGYIVDQGAAELKQLGFENVIVEAGGDLLASGAKDDQSLWKIGLQSPRSGTAELMTKIELRNKAAATSGDYLNSFTEDLSHHHIIDPLTGESSPDLASVTVIGQSALQADALATGIMVLGISDGLALVESLPGIEAYLVSKEMEIYQSSGF